SASGSSILDILERTPGILIDRQNESISMLGKEGVNVMINGKMSYMPAAALVQFLNGINAENAKTIELITTPPAKFDAQGNAGYINIELKQQLEKGYNGNMTSSLSIGSQRTNQNIGSNFNVSDQKSTLIFNYSIRKNYIPFVFDLSRSLSTNGQTETSNIKGARDNKREVHNIRFGYDYKINEHLNLGINVTGYANSYSMTEDKTIRRNTQPNNDLYFTSEDNFWKNVQTSFYSDLRLSENSILKFNFDYLRYANDQPVNYQIDLSASENTSQLTLDTTKNSPFTIYVNALDFETKKENGLQVTGGIKYVQNDFRNTNELQRNQVFDTTFASDSKLEESISAAYSQVHFNLSKNIKIQTGVRYEYTQTKVISLISNQEFINRKYGNFFPSFFMGYKINDFNNLNVSISQRI
ncbi:MAG: TonB-dependent receptor, partial [Flavobacteriaceae bacterium]